MSDNLTNLPTQIGYLKKLTSLDLTGSRLSSLPPQIGELKNLMYLTLVNNKLDRLPPEIGQLTGLISLNLSGNLLSSVPSQIGEIKKLSGLYLGDNQIGSLPMQISELTELIYLDLNDNQLSNFPSQIGELKSLGYLDLSYNLIAEEQKDSILRLLPKYCSIKLFTKTRIEPMAPPTAQQIENEKSKLKLFNLQEEAVKKDSTDYHNWFNLSFYALFAHEPRKSIAAAHKTLELHPEAVSVEANLALGYLLANEWPHAKRIYLKWKGKKFPNDTRLCEEVFLADIAELENAGISHPDFRRAENLLAE